MGGSFKTEGHSTGAGETLAVTTAPQAHKDAIAFSEADARRGRGTNISEVVVDRPPVRFTDGLRRFHGPDESCQAV